MDFKEIHNIFKYFFINQTYTNGNFMLFNLISRYFSLLLLYGISGIMYET